MDAPSAPCDTGVSQATVLCDIDLIKCFSPITVYNIIYLNKRLSYCAFTSADPKFRILSQLFRLIL